MCDNTRIDWLNVKFYEHAYDAAKNGIGLDAYLAFTTLVFSIVK